MALLFFASKALNQINTTRVALFLLLITLLFNTQAMGQDTSWIDAPSIKPAIQDVLSRYPKVTRDRDKQCSDYRGPLSTDDMKRLLLNTVSNAKRTTYPGKDPLLLSINDESFFIEDRFVYRRNKYKAYLCAEGAISFLLQARFGIAMLLSNTRSTPDTSFVSNTIKNPVYSKGEVVRVEGRSCGITANWSDITHILWNGDCGVRYISGTGVISWYKGEDIKWISNIGPKFGLVIDSGKLYVSFNGDDFGYQVEECDAGAITPKRTASIDIRNDNVSSLFFANWWPQRELIKIAVKYLQAKCPARQDIKLKNIRVIIRDASGNILVDAKNSNNDKIDIEYTANENEDQRLSLVAKTNQARLLAEQRRRERQRQIAIERQERERIAALESEARAQSQQIKTAIQEMYRGQPVTLDILAAALQTDMLRSIERLEDGAKLYIFPSDNLSTDDVDGRRAYKVTYRARSATETLRRKYSNERGFSWDEWMRVTGNISAGMLEFSCYFEEISDVPKQKTTFSVELRSFKQSSDQYRIEAFCTK